METGLIHIYEGDGKGKTTAAIGLAVRVAGAGGNVLFTQFLKDGTSSEISVLNKIKGMEVYSCTEKLGFVFRMNKEEKAAAAKVYDRYFEEIKKRLLKLDYHLLVLDEVLDACSTGILQEQKLYTFLMAKQPHLEVVMTGHSCTERLEQLADYYSKITKVHHPYDRGIKARMGIEK